MTFLLRAALAIGALSYLAMMREGADPAAEAGRLAAALPDPRAVLSTAMPSQTTPSQAMPSQAMPSPAGAALPAAAVAALEAVPAETRERAVRAVLARGLMAELSRRAGAAAEEPASRDTLEDGDRQPAWHGAAPR